MADLHLGGVIDPATHERTGDALHLDADDLVTHGVIVGMTGSGKTGLAIDLMEEALLARIPVLAIDPKGDLGNLALVFPELDAASFRPWIDEAQAAREGTSPEAAAEATATRWREGLASWGIGPDRLRALRDVADVTVYTPGSTAGVGLDLLASLAAPPAGAPDDARVDAAGDVAASLLALVGIDSDPLTGREHILLANLVDQAWTSGVALDLGTLVARVQDPPIRRLGVLELDTFYPAKDRTALALKLNGLLASPAFAAWAQGDPLDVEAWFGPAGVERASGKVPCAVVSIAHLSDEERQFTVALLLSRVVQWMRAQPGSSALRAVVYMDEVFGFVPPVASPPAKRPILTILKQARAYGLGMVLATQNPVDLDYKAISNAGTWLVGRLQTERDKARLVEGMRSAAGAVDVAAIEATISGLQQREFVLHRSSGGEPKVFATRWAMSYLAGPLTAPQLSALRDARAGGARATGAAATARTAPAGGGAASATAPGTAAPAATGPAGGAAAATPGVAPPAPPGPPTADDEVPLMPQVAPGVAVHHLDPAAGWATVVGAVPEGRRLEAAVAARVRVTFDERDLRTTDVFEAVVFPLTEILDPNAVRPVDVDARDLRPADAAPHGARYAVPDAPIAMKAWFTDVERRLRDHLVASRSLRLHKAPALKLVQRPGESDADFDARCRAFADDELDRAADALRDRYGRREQTLRNALERAEDRVADLAADVSAHRRSEVVSIGSSILGGLLGGRRSARGLASDARRVAGGRSRTRQTAQRAETAMGRVEDARADLGDLEAELADELLELDAAWDAKVAERTVLDIGLERDDVVVEQLALVWVPTRGAVPPIAPLPLPPPA